MYPMNSPIPLNSKAVVVHDVESQNRVEPNNSNVNTGNQGSQGTNGAPYANTLMSGSQKLQNELEKTGIKMKQHEDNLKFLKIQKNQLEDAILDLQVSLGTGLPSPTEGGDSSLGRGQEETMEQILKHDKSAAGTYCQLKSRYGVQLSNPTLTHELLGVVAMLGKVDDDNLSRLLSEFLGLKTMLALVCKTYDGVKSLETFDYEGIVSKVSGIYALGASVGQTVEGRFLVMCLENLRPYAGEIVADDPQRKLDLPKPRLPSGDIPAGFLGFAVNMVHVDRPHLFCLISSGCGLRETLFYNLFSRLQVYRSRAEMLLALPCITDGAVSLDGGIIKANGVFSLGSRQICRDIILQRFLNVILGREDVSVMFPRCSRGDRQPEINFELENQLKQKKWEKERLQDDIRRELALMDHEKYNFQLRKQEFLKFLADSSSFMTQHQMQTAGHRQAPR